MFTSPSEALIGGGENEAINSDYAPVGHDAALPSKVRSIGVATRAS